MSTAPFAPGSVGVLLAPHDLAAGEIVDEMLADARAADATGFDGVLVGEHHAGLAGYVPNPLQVLGWMLAETAHVWGAPCPLLLPLRPTGLVIEEVAWLAARHRARVGLGVAVGAAPVDFAVADVAFDDRTARYRAALADLVRALRGDATPTLADDPAVRELGAQPVPVVSGTTTVFGVRVAAAAGAGIMLDGLSPLSWSITLADAYRAAGGTGPVVLSRRAWLGDAPGAVASADVDRYRAFTETERHDRIRADDSMLAHREPDELAAMLHDARAATGADCLSLRVNLPGLAPAVVREQIETLGREVLPRLRSFAG